MRRWLAPSVTAAWWICRFHPELLDGEHLHVVLPGAGPIEAADAGRWFAFLPWLAGRPALKTQVTMVSGELLISQDSAPTGTFLRGCTLDGANRTQEARLVAAQPAAELFSGTLGQWRAQTGGVTDCCLLFAPGFEQHWEEWFAPGELLDCLRSGVPTGVFPYSMMDGLVDQQMLRICGMEYEHQDLTPNPWHLDHDMAAHLGSFAQFAWELRVPRPPTEVHVDAAALKEFEEAQDYVRDDFLELGDVGITRLGSRVEVRGAGGKGENQWLVLLPKHSAVLEATGQAGEYDDRGFTPFDPPVIVPPEALVRLKGTTDPLSRMLEAVRVDQQHIAPFIDDDFADDLDGDEPDDTLADLAGTSEADLKDGMQSLLKQAAGREVDADSFMRDMRIAGGLHGPTHPSWWDLLENLGWRPNNYVEEPDRLRPAFVLAAARRNVQLPVICEAYAYLPDDKEDDLAEEAKADVARRYPGGALLVFKDMPYREIEGHKYSFGGMLYWKKSWTPFAMCAALRSLDDLIDQVEGGFRIGMADPRFADDCYIAAPFNRMCHGADPNEQTPMIGLKSRHWVTLLPG